MNIAFTSRVKWRQLLPLHPLRFPPGHPLAGENPAREHANSEPRILTQRQRLTGILQHPEARLCQPLHRERLPRRGTWRKQLLGKLLFLRVSPARISNFQVPSHVPITTSPRRPRHVGINFHFLVYIVPVDGSCSPLN